MTRIEGIGTDGSFVRLTTDDTELLLPALAQAGGAFRVSGRNRLDVHGLEAGEVAFLAALHNARVSDLETVRVASTWALGGESESNDRRPADRRTGTLAA